MYDVFTGVIYISHLPSALYFTTTHTEEIDSSTQYNILARADKNTPQVKEFYTDAET